MKTTILSGVSAAALLLGASALTVASAQQLDGQAPAATEQPTSPTTPSPTTPTAPAPGGDTGAVESEPAPTGELQAEAAQPAGTIDVDEMLGADVVDSAGESVGSVSSVLVAPDGAVTHVVVSHGGFLGIGGKDVGIPWEQVTYVPEDGVLRVPGNVADFEAAPEFTTQADQQAEVPIDSRTPME